jgi:hypothetical protein
MMTKICGVWTSQVTAASDCIGGYYHNQLSEAGDGRQVERPRERSVVMRGAMGVVNDASL